MDKKRKKSRDKHAVPIKLLRASNNPIMKPRSYQWEAGGVFNAGAILIGGTVYLLYRAFSKDRTSSIGYASSQDGIHITKRLPSPVYIPREKFEIKKVKNGFSGCEDPRLTRIGQRIYMSYTAFDGDFSSIKLALTSIKVDDFLKKKWNWKKPVLITRPGQRHKNFVIFPEKIKNKFAILHRISPEVSIKYVKNLNEFDGTKFIQSRYEKVFRKGVWDSWIRGAGSPPIRTSLGWLVLYHAIQKKDPHRFKIGVMVLDFKNPTKIIYRSPGPILAPDKSYENRGKSGVVYVCGAVVRKEKLLVYYGGGDRVVCVASVKLSELLDSLEKVK